MTEELAQRFADAMGPVNRYYSSQFDRREITDPKTLWNYYVLHSRRAA
jgi:hypothetical protein